ncbi:choice-of-anchor D domain-containing protein [bacterium]|nr:choice-of-anchor D domain-containing protein [bacterium]
MTSPQLRIIALILLFAPHAIVQAQWSSDPSTNNPICRAGNNQLAPQLISDGKGGTILCWSDERAGQNLFNVTVQRIDRDGVSRWTENGVVISSVSVSQAKPEIISDDAGGAIVVWGATRSEGMGIFAQRIDSLGNVLWTEDGVPVSSISKEHLNPKLASDGQHGAIITWSARTEGNQDDHIYAQRITATGSLAWNQEIVLSNSDQFESTPCIARDGSGGAYVSWVFYNNAEYDVIAQRISSSGAQLWQANGIGIATGGGAQDTPALIADSTGKAFLTYYDWSSGSVPTLHIVILNPDGSIEASLPAASTSGGQMNPQMALISAGSLGLVWEDGRAGSKFRSYAQIIDNSGQKSWAADGVEVSGLAGAEATPSLASDGSGGMIVAWEDKTNGVLESDILVQRLSAAGALLWSSSGVTLCNAGRMQQNPQLIGDGENGAIVAWEDYRSSFSNPDIYASRILADGTMPLEPPVLTFSTNTVDFGVVDVGTPSTKTITLSNTGGTPVTITSVTSGDPHFSLTSDSSTISPKSSAAAQVRFQPTSLDSLTAFIVLESNSIMGPDTVFVTGSGKASPAIELDRTSLAFGSVQTGSSKSLVLNISNPGNDTLRISSITSDNSDFTVAISDRTLPPGEAFDDTVRFTPSGTGSVTGELTLLSNAPTSPTIVPLSGEGTETVVVTLTLDPAEISFGEVEVGAHRDTTVTITNTGNDTLRISSFTSDDSHFTLETPLESIAPAASGTFTLRFTPESTGPLGAMFTVTSNAASSPDTILVDGTGMDVSAVHGTQRLPQAFTLYQNYPNPFHPSTTIRFEMRTSASVRLTVYNGLGQQVATIIDGMRSPGIHTVQWRPAHQPPGVYILMMRAGTQQSCVRMVLAE